MRGEPVFPDPLDAIGATEFADPREPAIELTARRVSGCTTGKEAARRLFEWVRDEVAYDMAPDLASPREWGAGATLARGSGFCQQKAVLLVALLRARGIPAGIVVQDILDHRITPRYLRLLGSRRFEVHTLACAHLDGRWLRLDPTLDRALVERKGYRLVEFDGESDALLPATDLAGRPHFELIGELGAWLDVSRELMEPVIQSACLRDPEYLELMRRDGPAI